LSPQLPLPFIRFFLITNLNVSRNFPHWIVSLSFCFLLIRKSTFTPPRNYMIYRYAESISNQISIIDIKQHP